MQYVQIVCPQTLLEECVELLGENGVFQFVDRNRAYTTVQRGALHTRFAHAIKELHRYKLAHPDVDVLAHLPPVSALV